MIPILTFLFFSSFAASRRKSSDRRSSPRKSARSFFYTHRSFHTIRNPTNRKRIRTEKIPSSGIPGPLPRKQTSRDPAGRKIPQNVCRTLQSGKISRFRTSQSVSKPDSEPDPLPANRERRPKRFQNRFLPLYFSLIFHVNQYARQARPAPAYFSNIQSIQMKGQVMKL